MMKSKKFLPSEILKPFVKHFMIIESESGMRNKVLPDTSIVMTFAIKGTVTYTEEAFTVHVPSSCVTGLRKYSRLMQYSSESARLLVMFREGGAAAFFKVPVHELFGESIALDNLISKQRVLQVEEQLAECENNNQRIALVEQFLISALAASPSNDHVVKYAIQQIRSAQGNIRIKDLATGLHISQDPFEKRFRKSIGCSPKQFATIVRMRHIIHAYAKTHTLTDAAYSGGYFDQAHFIKGFRTFTGQAPFEFFKSADYW